MNKRMPIRVEGPWAWAWGANIFALWGLSIWGWLIDRSVLLPVAAAWMTWFLLQEAVGIVGNLRAKGPELARTFSQVMQAAALLDPSHNFMDTLTGLDLFVTGNCLLAGLAVGYVFSATWGRLGWIMGVVVVAWLYFHWHHRVK